MKILVSPYTHTLSHLSRPLLVAKELRKRGHEVVFAGDSPKTKFIEQEGFRVIPIYEPNPDMLFRNIREGKLKFVADSEIEQMTHADLILYKSINPDIILSDGRFTAPISAQIAGIKHVAIVNVSSTEYRALPYMPLFEWLPQALVGRETGLRRALDVVNIRLEMFVFDNVMNIFKKLSKKYGLRKNVTASNCLTGKDITLLPDIPQYFPTGNLPGDYHYIGPLTWKSNIPAPTWWPPQKSKRPLVYVTMGTTGIPDFFLKIYDLFKASGMSAIITTGGQVQNLTDVRGKIYVEPFIDGDLAVEECDLVVCHGGNGTIYQALQHGKPIIGIPTIPDQKFNMRRVEALGVGRTLSWKNFSKNSWSLVQLIMMMTKDNFFYQNAAEFKNLLKTYNAAQTAADIIEEKNHVVI